jgi:hypothetical protein
MVARHTGTDTPKLPFSIRLIERCGGGCADHRNEMSGAADPRIAMSSSSVYPTRRTQMTLNGTPCSCGGLNANCFHCFGTGVNDKAASTNHLYISRPTRRSSFQLPKRKLAQCPRCHAAIRAERVARRATCCPKRQNRPRGTKPRRRLVSRKPTRASLFWPTTRRTLQTIDEALE